MLPLNYTLYLSRHIIEETMIWQNKLTKLLDIQYPIIQAPMLGVTTPEMVAAVSNSGGLGSLPVGGLSPEITRERIQKTKALTNKPFAVNLFVNALDNVNLEEALAIQDFLDKLGKKHNLEFDRKSPGSFTFYSYKEQVDILIEENIPVVSFTFGWLDNECIKQLKANNIILIGTATSVKEARLLEDTGIDAITAQGVEAGGHRGTFINDEPLPQVGLMSLLPQIADSVSIPVLAAGGINDGRTIKAAFTLGASAVQIGTAFIASNESLAIPSYKNRLLYAQDTDTQLTKAFSGRWARGIRNTFMAETEQSGLTIPEYTIQNSITGPIRAAAIKQDNNELTNMWSGQSAPKIKLETCSDIFKELVEQTEKLN